MPVDLDIMTLAHLEEHRGLGELFQEALREVAEDIDNPNKDGKARRITVDLVFQPTDDRQVGGVSFTVSTKLRPREPGFASVVFRDGAVQLNIDAGPGEDPRQGVAKFPKGGGA